MVSSNWLIVVVLLFAVTLPSGVSAAPTYTHDPAAVVVTDLVADLLDPVVLDAVAVAAPD